MRSSVAFCSWSWSIGTSARGGGMSCTAGKIDGYSAPGEQAPTSKHVASANHNGTEHDGPERKNAKGAGTQPARMRAVILRRHCTPSLRYPSEGVPLRPI